MKKMLVEKPYMNDMGKTPNGQQPLVTGDARFKIWMDSYFVTACD